MTVFNELKCEVVCVVQLSSYALKTFSGFLFFLGVGGVLPMAERPLVI